MNEKSVLKTRQNELLTAKTNLRYFVIFKLYFLKLYIIWIDIYLQGFGTTR